MRLLTAFFALFVVSALSDRVLVLIDNAKIKETHSIFLQKLSDAHKVTVKLADDSSVAVRKHGELAYEHVILLAPSVEQFGGETTVEELTAFVDAGGNLLVAGDSNLGEAARDLAAEHGFEFDTADTAVIDHFNHDANLDAGDHTTIVASKDQLSKTAIVVGDTSKLNNVLFKGVALVSAKGNKLGFPILRAASTAYSYKPNVAIKDYPGSIGQQTLLIAGFQARNNARVVFTGSLALFSDAFIKASVQKAGSADVQTPSGNGPLIDSVVQWLFKQQGVLRVKSVRHHKVGEKLPPNEYTITDDVEFKNGKWQPFSAKDVQLEFVRIDPFVRTALVGKNGVFYKTFKLPDVYGVFKFVVDYRRPGYTHLYDVQQVSVRPLWHTQYERFIRSAYPYYASSFSMMAGVVIFSIVFLHYKDTPAAAADKKTN